MPRFPEDENKVIELAQKVANGIASDSATFPHPPVDPQEIIDDLNLYFAKTNELQLIKAAKMQKTQEKKEVFKRLKRATRSSINYGNIVADGDNAILEQIGWGNRAAPKAIKTPGQCSRMEIAGQGDGFVKLYWKEPEDGGKVAAYKVQRSEDDINFSDAATVIKPEAILHNQPKGKKLMYRAIAINRAGEGVPSNTISIVL